MENPISEDSDHLREHKSIATKTEQVQPWKEYLDEIAATNTESPSKKDLFELREGLNDQSMAA